MQPPAVAMFQSGGGMGGDSLQFYSAPTDNTGFGMAQSFGSIGGSSAFDSSSTSSSSFEDEPPLLEELGINFDHIKSKTMAVLNPRKPVHAQLMADTDLAGPLVFCALLGFCLLLTGKVHFGYIYGFGMVGCILLYGILNLMSEEGIDMYRTMSILGYCLLPIVFLAALNVVVNLRGAFGVAVTPLAILWCTYSATRFIERALDMQEQRWLIAYPVSLLFSCFAMITVF